MVPTNELEPPSAPARRWRFAVTVLAVIAAGAALAYGLLKPAPPARTSAGKSLPEFTLQRLDGKGTVSSGDLVGRPLVINFWGSWCDPCKEEVPRFQAAWEQYAGRGVTILGVDLRDAPDNARAFVRKEGVTYPVVVDPDETLARALHVGGLPQTFFVDSDGRFQTVGGESGTVVLGAISDKLLNDEIKDMLTGVPN